MSNISLNIGLRALQTAQTALDAAGHNIANANTPGYSRQSLAVSAGRPMNSSGIEVGSGVQADRMTRTVDDLLNRRITGQVSSLSGISVTLLNMQQVEGILGEPGGFGLSGRLDNFFGSLSSLTASPEDSILRTGVVQAAESITEQLHNLMGDLDQQRIDAAQSIELQTREVNAKAELIGQLNIQIVATESTGVMANDLRDQRDLALRELAEITNITYHEQPNGSVRVQVSGQLLVSENHVNEMSAQADLVGDVEIMLGDATQPLTPTGGALGGLVEFSQEFVPELQNQLNDLASSMIHEMNRQHARGIPPDGGFTHLTAVHGVVDANSSGGVRDELLAFAGLPVEIERGELYINVTNGSSGDVTSHRIDIDPDRMTVGEFLFEVSQISDLSAGVDSAGRLQITAGNGSRFDFGARLQDEPDPSGTFGGAHASLGSIGGPFDLSSLPPGNMLDFGTFQVSLAPSDFADMSQATAEEIATAFNADPGAQANLIRAVAVGEHVVFQTLGEGSSETFTLAGGTALGALGLTGGTVVNGHDAGVDVRIEGTYTGPDNDLFTFHPTSDGEIGTSPNLQVEVRDENGLVVTTLDVGAGYIPGTMIEVADGLSVSFSFGNLSATDGDVFAEHLISNSDTSDLLVAFGLNAMFSGVDASTIQVRDDLANDPRLFSASATGSAGDGGNLLAMLELQDRDLDGLGVSLSESYGAIIGNIGFDVSSKQSAVEVEQYLLDSLDARRDQISGVNIDEEMVNIIEFEQAFGAAARFIQVVNQLNDEILAIL